MHTNYEGFYSEYKRFCVKVKLANEDQLQGLTNEEIIRLLDIKHLNRKSQFITHLRFIGRKHNVYLLKLGFNADKIREALEVEAEYIERSRANVLSRKGHIDDSDFRVKPWIERINVSMNSDNDSIRVIGIYLENDLILFTDLNSEEFIYYFFNVWSNKVEDYGIRLINQFRGILYIGVTRYIYLDMYNTTKKDSMILSIPWVKYYEKISAKKLDTNIRSLYTQGIYNIEKESGVIYSIDEFEREFIKHLIENHNAPYLPDVYDPYNDLRTFEEYLQD